MIEMSEQRKRVLKIAYCEGISSEGASVSKKLGIKNTTVNYILEKLKEEKYYTRNRYELNLDSLGIGRFAWLFVSINRATFDENKFVAKALGLPQVHTLATTTGSYDYAIKIFGPSVQNINAFILGFEKLFEGIISDTFIYFANTTYKRHFVKLGKEKLLKLKKVDSILLEERTFNPKEKLSDIAKKYHLHRNTVSNRWNALLENRVILKETLDLTQKGYEAIGLGLKAFIVIKPTPGHEERLVKVLLKEPKIQDLFSTLSNEIVAIVRTENSQSLLDIHRLLFKMPNSIKYTDTLIFLSKHSRAGWTKTEIQNLLPTP